MRSGGGDTPHHPVVDALRALNLALQRTRVDFAAEQGVTVGDTLVLSRLAAAPDGRLRPGVLAGQLGLGSGTVTAMLDRLEGAGLVARVSNPDDRRSTLVELQDRGRRAVVRGTERLAAAIDSALTAEQQASLGGYLDALAVSIDRTSAERGAAARGAAAREAPPG